MIENKILYDFRDAVLADRVVLQIAELSGQEFARGGYRFDITLSAERAVAGGLVGPFQPATLIIPSDQIFHGVIGNSLYHTGADGKTHGVISLIPRLWQLKTLRRRRIFRRQSLRRMVTRVLKEDGFSSGSDFRFELRRRYRAHPYCLQHGESDLDFVLRLLDQEGLSFFFEQGEEREILVISDEVEKHSPVNGRGATHYYFPGGILDSPQEAGVRRYGSHPPTGVNSSLPTWDMFPERLVQLNGEAQLIIPGRPADHPIPGQEIPAIATFDEDQNSSHAVHILGTAEASIESRNDKGLRIAVGGSELQIDPAGILLKSGAARIRMTKEGTIEIGANGNLLLQGENLHASGEGDLQISAGGNLKILARQDLSQKAHNVSSEAKVVNRTKGLTVKSEAAGLNEVKGALVKVN